MNDANRSRPARHFWLAGITLLVWMLVGGWLLASSISDDPDDPPEVAAATADAPDPGTELVEEANPNPSRPESGLGPGDCLVDIRGTRLDLTRSREELEKRGVHTSTVWPTTRRGDSVALAVATSYRVNCLEFGPVEPEAGTIYLDGYIGHRGGIRFATDSGQLEIRRPRINVNNGTLDGHVTGSEGTRPFFNLWWSQGVRADSGETFRLQNIPVVLTGEAASLLNQTLSTAAFFPGTVIGEMALAGTIRLAGPPAAEAEQPAP